MFGYSTRFITGSLLLNSLIACAQDAAPKLPPARSVAEPKIVLVELFTSEGCSSCPPADDLLRKINGTRTQTGELIVGISEHVTYWNSLGWSDPFSSSTYTDRQNAYGARFGLDDVYTPQMIFNGEKQVVGNDRAGVFRAIQSEGKQPSPISVRILATSIEKNMLTVNFSAVGEASVHEAAMIAVIADDLDQSSVTRGENSGRTLTHVAVARSFARIPRLQAKAYQSMQISLPESFRASEGHHLILFAQTAGNGRVLGAATKSI